MMFIQPDWPCASVFSGTLPRTTLDGVLLSDSLPDFYYAVDHFFSSRKMGLSSPFWLNQVHGHVVHRVEGRESFRNFQDGDALITDVPGVLLAIRTADCIPVFLTDNATFVSIIHGGWRGLSSGIIDNVLKEVSVFPDRLFVWLGPAISKEHFIVGEDVLAAFSHLPAYQTHFSSCVEEGKWFCDLYGLCRSIFHQHDVSHIFGGEFCTYKQKEHFYSYRRNPCTKKRMVSFISLRER